MELFFSAAPAGLIVPLAVTSELPQSRKPQWSFTAHPSVHNCTLLPLLFVRLYLLARLWPLAGAAARGPGAHGPEQYKLLRVKDSVKYQRRSFWANAIQSRFVVAGPSVIKCSSSSVCVVWMHVCERRGRGGVLCSVHHGIALCKVKENI